MAVTVYGAVYSTYTRSVLIALREKGVDYTVSDIDIFSPIPADYLARHPWGKIPAFDHDGFSIYETNAILGYIAESFPGVELRPGTPKDHAVMTQVIGIIDSYAYKPMVVELFVQRAAMPKMGHPSDEVMISGALPEVEKTLDALLAIKGGHPFMAGSAFSLADLHFAPVFAYVMQTPEGRAIVEKRPALGAWWAEVSKRPSVVATKSPLEG